MSCGFPHESMQNKNHVRFGGVEMLSFEIQIWFNVRLCRKQMFCLEKMSSSLFRHAFCISSNCFQGLHKNILDTAKNTQHFDSVHVAEKSLEPSEIGWTGHFLAIKKF